MKNILPLNNFLLEEALPLNLAKKYVKMGEERNPATTAKMDVVFNKKQRLYLPVQKKVKSKIEPQIKEFLASIGYEIKSYVGNLAFKSDNPRREGRIGKLLSQNNRPDLQDLFLKDPTRELATKQAEYSVVVSRHPYDIAGMSCGTGREPWHSSCLNLKRPDGSVGMNAHYVPKEIKNGTLTAYYIRTEDKNINKPLGRVNIKPYKKEEELDQKDKQKCYFPDTRVYGSFPPDAILALKEWILSWQGDLTGDFYKWKGCYDYDGTAYHIRVSNGMSIQQIEGTRGNRNVNNFTIVNDVVNNGNNNGENDCPEGELEDILEMGRTIDFHQYIAHYSDYGHNMDYNFHVNVERIDDNCTPLTHGSYLHYNNVTNLTLDYTREQPPLIDGSWGVRQNNGEPEILLNSVRGLTFKEAGIKDFMSFYNGSNNLQLFGSLVFENCNFKARDLPNSSIGGIYPDILEEGWSFEDEDLDLVDHAELKAIKLNGNMSILIAGGDIINTLNILNIIQSLYLGRGPIRLDISIIQIDTRDKTLLERLEFEMESTNRWSSGRITITKDW